MKLYSKIIIALFICMIALTKADAQTDLDAIMMSKNQLCIGPMYGYSSWKNYWEGTLKRDNLNLGTVSTTTAGVMGAYGINGKLNILFNVPYVSTKASAGTLHGMKGFQDASLFVKWLPVEKNLGKGVLSLYLLGGVSTPLSNYTADFLPLSIGLKSKTASARVTLDYQVGHFFTTTSATYVARSNIKIDRTSYYTTELIASNEVAMPDATNFNVRIGYRSSWLIAEAFANNWTTLGGFDITRNNMPFPSNRMNAISIGAGFKYTFLPSHGLSLVGNASTVVAGRNVGQATTYDASIFYILDFSRKTKSSKKTDTK
jgi:hypothetical protein